MSRGVVIGMSGGVDSSVATWLLKEQSYDVIGVTMRTWQDENAEIQEAEDGCHDLGAANDARRVAIDLGIPYYVMDFKEEFRKNVMDHFAGEYAEGGVPSPCIVCNRHVKWESLLRRSMVIEADYIATGHYAQVDSLPGGRYSLKTSVTATKDQTHALYNLTQERLSHTLMPVGSYHKEEMWNMTEHPGLPAAHESGSREICFIPDHDYASFTEEYTGRELPSGSFAGLGSNVLGRHRGTTHYTVGQGKGLNLSMGRLVSMVEIRPEANEVIVGDDQNVFVSVLRCDKLSWMAVDGLRGRPMDISVKIRYSHKESSCTVREVGYDMVECRFHEPVRTVTPGQAVVFYDGDYVAGGGTIIR